MKFEAGKEYKTRDGKKVRIYSTDTNGNSYNLIHGAVLKKGVWHCFSWNENGHFINDEMHNFDLMPNQREFWVNIYARGNVSNIHKSRVKALAAATDSCLETIKVREVLEDE